VGTILEYWAHENGLKTKRGTHIVWSKVVKDDREFFPLKSHIGARTKANVFFRDVVTSLKKHGSPARTVETMVLFAKHAAQQRLYNDEASALLMWTYVALHHLTGEQVALVLSNFKDEKSMKRLNVIVKACGVGSDKSKAILCEMVTMYGRSTGEVDWVDEIESRTKMRRYKRDKAANVDIKRLKEEIRLIYSRELGEVRFQDLDDYWSRRWTFTKSGGHQKRIEKMVYGSRVTQGNNVTRRMFAESVSGNVLLGSKPAAYAGTSIKLEPGKSRALYGCDTINYFHFDYVLKAVEKTWKNTTALLQPSKGAQDKEYSAYAKMMKRYQIMMDYDDFNSQHTQEAKHAVFTVLRDVLESRGINNAVLDWCCESILHEYVSHMGSAPVKVVGGLFSGHRATTFINTILNEAYMRVVLGKDMPSVHLHAGDDIWMSVDSTREVEAVMEKMKTSGVRMNPQKQALGTVSAEFLRCSFTGRAAVGYVARAIATCVAGNWVNEAQLGSQEYIQNYINMAWTIRVRSGVDNAGVMLVDSFIRRVEVLKGVAYHLMTQQMSFARSPTIGATGVVKTVIPRYKRTKKRLTGQHKDYATKEYLSKHVDHGLLKEVGIKSGKLYPLMLEASYAGEVEQLTTIESYYVTEVTIEHTVTRDLCNRKAAELEGKFPYAYFRNQFSERDTYTILKALGIEVARGVDEHIWKTTAFNVAVVGIMPYSAAASVSRCAPCPIAFRCEYPVAL
jgi:hypothetical protein